MIDDIKQKVVNCEFVFKCPQQWNLMKRTESDGVRFCGECERNVYFAESAQELDKFSREGKCVAVFQEISGSDLPESAGSDFSPDRFLNVTAGFLVAPERLPVQNIREEKPETGKSRIPLIAGIIVGSLLAGILIGALFVKFFK
jgi:hypothetical protein